MTTVLVVDDEPIVRDVVTRYLERDGHTILTADTGDEARGLIEGEAPSLVVLDVMLPGETDGLALCRWIRATSDLPVILLTARGDEADRIVGLALGADAYVTNPFSPRELATRVTTVLLRARHRDRHRPRATAAREARGRRVAAGADRDGLGRRLPAPSMILVPLVLGLGVLAVGLALAAAVRLLPTLRLQVTALALLAVCLPLGVVLASGWVMFGMHDDAKVLAVSLASALSALVRALLLARWVLGPLERLRAASARLAGGELTARAS